MHASCMRSSLPMSSLLESQKNDRILIQNLAEINHVQSFVHLHLSQLQFKKNAEKEMLEGGNRRSIYNWLERAPQGCFGIVLPTSALMGHLMKDHYLLDIIE